MLKRIRKNIETGVLVTALVVPLWLCVFAFLGVACYFAFRETLSPPLAALVTVAAAIVLIAFVLVFARIFGGGRKRPEPRSVELGDDLEEFLREHADPVLSRWVRSNPDKAALTTLALGIAAGYSDQFRRVLFDLYARYSESETVRRSRRPDTRR